MQVLLLRLYGDMSRFSAQRISMKHVVDIGVPVVVTEEGYSMLVNLKKILDMYHPVLAQGMHGVCDLRTQDPDFNHGHGERFFAAFERAIRRGDLK